MSTLARAVLSSAVLHLALGAALWLRAPGRSGPPSAQGSKAGQRSTVRVALWTPPLAQASMASAPSIRPKAVGRASFRPAVAKLPVRSVDAPPVDEAGGPPAGAAEAASGAVEDTPGAPGPGTSRPVPLPGGAGSSEQTLHSRLAESARRCYPEAARRFSLQGEVVLSFCLRLGNLATVALQGSTGSGLLDRAARECVVQGALPLAAEGCYRVPVRFQRDER